MRSSSGCPSHLPQRHLAVLVSRDQQLTTTRRQRAYAVVVAQQRAGRGHQQLRVPAAHQLRQVGGCIGRGDGEEGRPQDRWVEGRAQAQQSCADLQAEQLQQTPCKWQRATCASLAPGNASQPHRPCAAQHQGTSIKRGQAASQAHLVGATRVEQAVGAHSQAMHTLAAVGVGPAEGWGGQSGRRWVNTRDKGSTPATESPSTDCQPPTA